jgi:hypothetical protein
VASWGLGLRHGQEPVDLGYHDFFGFGVDAGMACVVDADACDRLSEVSRDLDDLVEPRDDVIGAAKMVAWSSATPDPSGWPLIGPARRADCTNGSASVYQYDDDNGFDQVFSTLGD